MFKTPELQREHYKLDWHRYNLKRKVAGILPVNLEEFELRAKEHRDSTQNASRDESQYCKYCSKLFNTKNAFTNHLNSKRHKLLEDQYSEEEHSGPSDTDSYVKVEASSALPCQSEPGKFVVVNTNVNNDNDEDIETDSDIEEASLNQNNVETHVKFDSFKIVV